ncbi:MAG: hypothetical protein HFH41_07605 [Lachnospiraceae bacterium]|nr:hypothetical protein [Lachnospiraceae bacterium]
MDHMWKQIRQFDNPPKNYTFSFLVRMNQRIGQVGTGGKYGMFLFLSYSIYFMIAVLADYQEPAAMADAAAAVTMCYMFFSLVRFTRREGEEWRSVYQKIMYFPVDRRMYLLAKLVPAVKVIGLQLAMQWLALGYRVMMHQEIAGKTVWVLTLVIIGSGLWYFLTFLVMMVWGNLYLFPLPILPAVCLVHAAASYL